MDERAFRAYLKKHGRADPVIEQTIEFVAEFENFVVQNNLDAATPDELEKFVTWIESGRKADIKGYLQAIGYYYCFTQNKTLATLAADLRRQRISVKPFALNEFRGVRAEAVEALATAGIRNADQMRQAGCNAAARQALAQRTGLSLDTILELVKLSELARLPGVKGIRARLYYDAGLDTLDKLAAENADELGARLNQWVAQNGFDGIAPLPQELRNTIQQARTLARDVVYEE